MCFTGPDGGPKTSAKPRHRVTRTRTAAGRPPEESTVSTIVAALQTLSFVVTDRLAAVKEEKGASAVEYALLVAAVAAAIGIAVGVLGPQLQGMFNNIIP